jgi:hypothetical protein
MRSRIDCCADEKQQTHRRQIAGRGQMVKMDVARNSCQSPGLDVESVGQEWVSSAQIRISWRELAGERAISLPAPF